MKPREKVSKLAEVGLKQTKERNCQFAKERERSNTQGQVAQIQKGEEGKRKGGEEN